MRDPRALTTHKLLVLASRTAPAPGGDAGGRALAGQGSGAVLSHSLLQGGFAGEGRVC